MSRCHSVVTRPLVRQLCHRPAQQGLARPFSTTMSSWSATTSDAQQQQPQQTSSSPLDQSPDTVLPEFEDSLIRAGKMPVGSRRRRVAMRTTTDSLPFEQLPYQAFQEARKILAADRQDKLQRIRDETAKISWLEARDASLIKGGQYMKDTKLASLRRYVEQLKILADINDPLVKKRFEDGLGDMDKPIYRHYAEKRWRSYNYKLIKQRISQFHVVPDILPKLEPTADVQLYFGQQKTPAGQVVDSLLSERPPRLRVQVFDKGERLVSVVVMDADVPDAENDSFYKRCHFMAANVPLSPTQTSLPLGRIRADDQLAVPWLPAFAQKGAPYHRLAIFLLEQKPGERIDVARLRELYASKRDGFSLKSFRGKFSLNPVGFTMFRSVWDDNTADVMARHKLPGADVEFRPTRVRSLKTPVKPRGWEAKHQGPKYRHLWKYTKRIRGLSNANGWTKRK
ncbi:large subunit ribosomal protein L35 [Geosmithia morbida]|uniref:Large ribosomal subunit protein mL38 n=1 Tax=Geosmithia morbida TaxID=1094350 RepID=A0A9P4YRR1_9HYPO|nr:large subunit ribosomal protein L35 [Geosmithia morbida]KAF4120622.1 large subunit ribosomal protein L35 [Geosmithia morbida]